MMHDNLISTMRALCSFHICGQQRHPETFGRVEMPHNYPPTAQRTLCLVSTGCRRNPRRMFVLIRSTWGSDSLCKQPNEWGLINRPPPLQNGSDDDLVIWPARTTDNLGVKCLWRSRASCGTRCCSIALPFPVSAGAHSPLVLVGFWSPTPLRIDNQAQIPAVQAWPKQSERHIRFTLSVAARAH